MAEKIHVYRQGDIAFIKLDQAPKGLKKIRKKVIRKGEHGGIHLLEKGDIYIDEKTRTMYVGSDGNLLVRHTTSHKDLELPPGFYEVRIQRELTGWIRD
ncbi:MAG: hypothetical protein QXI58_00900 [Candidatus Micrarchaeia archaeon]